MRETLERCSARELPFQVDCRADGDQQGVGDVRGACVGGEAIVMVLVRWRCRTDADDASVESFVQ